MKCTKQDPETTCPKLECPEEERINIQNECCPICKGKSKVTLVSLPHPKETKNKQKKNISNADSQLNISQ